MSVLRDDNFMNGNENLKIMGNLFVLSCAVLFKKSVTFRVLTRLYLEHSTNVSYSIYKFYFVQCTDAE